MEPLSDVLISLKLEAAAISIFDFRMPWGVAIESFNYAYCCSVIEGACWFTPKGSVPRLLTTGDSVVAIRGGSFTLAGKQGVLATPMGEIWEAQGLPHINDGTFRHPVTLRWGGDGERTRILALAFSFDDDRRHPLLCALPDLFLSCASHSGRIPWLGSAIEFLAIEEGERRIGYGAIARELATLIFMSLVRTYVLETTNHPPGWLRALGDGRISAALSALHDEPGRNWSVASLAQHVGMSRSTFAVRFKALVEQSPIAYLAEWRAHLAAERLRGGAMKISRLADELGYSSERAFRRAFKQIRGEAPRVYRRTNS